MRVIILGSGGWIPTKERQTFSLLIEDEGTLFLIDLGSGVFNLGNYEHILNKYHEIHIIMTHYHLDHTVGVTFIRQYLHNKKVHLYGPSRYKMSVKEQLSRLLVPDVHALPFSDIFKDVECHHYDKMIKINRTLFVFKEQNHSSPSFNIMINNRFMIATDTTIDADYIKQLPQGGILLHECWTLDEGHQNHTSLNELAPFKFIEIYLIHLNPYLKNDDYQNFIDKKGLLNIKVGYDGLVIEEEKLLL